MKRKPLTKYERQLRRGLRAAIAAYPRDADECPDCSPRWYAEDEPWGSHASECIVSIMRDALRRPK